MDSTSPYKVFKKEKILDIMNYWKMENFPQEYLILKSEKVNEIDIKLSQKKEQKTRYSNFRLMRLFILIFIVFFTARFFPLISHKRPKSLENYGAQFVESTYNL